MPPTLVRDAYLTVAPARLRKGQRWRYRGTEVALTPKKLRIDLEQLRWARGDQTGELSLVLDTETGDVLIRTLPTVSDARLRPMAARASAPAPPGARHAASARGRRSASPRSARRAPPRSSG